MTREDEGQCLVDRNGFPAVKEMLLVELLLLMAPRIPGNIELLAPHGWCVNNGELPTTIISA